MPPFSAYELLNRKRRGIELSAPEIDSFIAGFTSGAIPDYQMSAFLMAVAIRGMSDEETAALTRAMQRSGEEWSLRDEFDFIADKHSTGGVGDKVSIVLAPWVAACGVSIGMISGRGLGHTGGTLDKLEAIPGFNAHLNREQFVRCIRETGCAITTSTDDIAPADRRMYALRDVTGTVQSIPLITASIMSKKLAMGASALILDVKTGKGAFIEDADEARKLARALVEVAVQSGTRAEALITDMNQPLGIAAGNANEIAESMAVLRGEGPDDVEKVTRAQAVRLLRMSGRYTTDEEASRKLTEVVESGEALKKARSWITAQGGDPSVAENAGCLPAAKHAVEVHAPRDGFIEFIDTYAMGMLAVDLGAGRRKAEDKLDYSAGLMFDRNVGDAVGSGEVIGRILFTDRGGDPESLRKRYLANLTISQTAPVPRPLILETVKRAS